MFRIYAKKSTSKKMFLWVPIEKTKSVQNILNNRYGGDWVLVETLHPSEGLIFEDTMIYKGFHPDVKRYSNAIVNIWE